MRKSQSKLNLAFRILEKKTLSNQSNHLSMYPKRKNGTYEISQQRKIHILPIPTKEHKLYTIMYHKNIILLPKFFS